MQISRFSARSAFSSAFLFCLRAAAEISRRVLAWRRPPARPEGAAALSGDRAGPGNSSVFLLSFSPEPEIPASGKDFAAPSPRAEGARRHVPAAVCRFPGRRVFLAGSSAALARFLLDGPAVRAAVPDPEAPFPARHVLLGRVRRSLGRPYVLGAEGPSAFDCSGLIRWLYAGIGLSLPRLAKDQGSTGMPVRDSLRFGDVILFKRLGSGWHIGMFLARGFFVHAAGREKGVIISSLRESYFRKQFRGARRYLR